jgi:hypothetical protein
LVQLFLQQSEPSQTNPRFAKGGKPMHRRKFVPLILIASLLWAFSSLAELYDQSASLALAGFLPTPTLRAKPLMYGATGWVYLPLLSRVEVVPQPPASTTSRYVQISSNIDILYQEGRSQGQVGQQGIIILDFGDPTWPYGLGYGTYRFDAKRTFTPLWAIKLAAENFAYGYYQTAPPGSRITLGIGTNSYGTGVTYEHGQAWGQMVQEVNDWITGDPSYADKVWAAGANDIEHGVGWSDGIVTKNWVKGFASVSQTTGIWYYNFGNCPGCATAPGYGWSYEDVWYVSQGADPAYLLPEIYGNSNSPTYSPQADQWYAVGIYTYDNHNHTKLVFQGALTQWAACQGSLPGAVYCRSNYLDNTPADGWRKLYSKLNSDPRTSQDLPWSSDMTWAE